MSRPRDFAALTVLCFLNEGDRHPYEMLRLVRQRHKDNIIPGLPRSIYRAIERLQADGLIEPVETTREGRRPERTVYRITPDGGEEMVTQLTRLVTTPEEIPAFGAALSLLGNLDGDLQVSALRQRRIRLEGRLAEYAAQLAAAGPHLEYKRVMELDYLCAVGEAELDWLRRVLATLRDEPARAG